MPKTLDPQTAQDYVAFVRRDLVRALDAKNAADDEFRRQAAKMAEAYRLADAVDA